MNQLDWSPEEFLRKLQGHLTWARVRVKLYVMISQARRDEETRDALEVGRLFFQMAEDAFYLDAGLTVHNLLSQKEYGGLIKYLNKSIQDIEKIDYSGDELTSSQLNHHLAQVREYENEISRLKNLRDKWFAHHDESAFQDPKAFVHKHYVSPEELMSMIDVAQSVLLQHFHAFGSDFSPGLSRETDFLSIVDVLKRYHEVHKLRFMDPEDEEKAIDLLFHAQYGIADRLRSKYLGSD